MVKFNLLASTVLNHKCQEYIFYPITYEFSIRTLLYRLHVHTIYSGWIKLWQFQLYIYLDFLEEKSLANGLIRANGYQKLREKTLVICRCFIHQCFPVISNTIVRNVIDQIIYFTHECLNSPLANL